MKLSRPLVILDLETTGTWIEKDKIIEIGMVKRHPDGQSETYCKRVNPGLPIPPIVTEITGIADADLKDAPSFKTIASEVVAFIGDADLGGFNVERFDLPVLARELEEAGIAFAWRARAVYDAQKIFHLHEKRDLSAAYKFYCAKDLENAHSALADSEATLAVLEEQVKKYGSGSDELEDLQEFDYKQTAEFFDYERKFRWWNGELYMMFGKYARNISLRVVASKDPNYLEWILSKDFSPEIKSMVEKALKGVFPQQES